MNEIWGLILALSVGLLLGAIFFGGLWWTVRQALSAQRPAVWFLSSMLLRTAIALTGFYFIADHDSRRLVVCLVGFVIARVVTTRLTQLLAIKATALTPEAGYAS